MKDFKDKVIVITGGATGIGFGYARAFGKEGAKVVISGLREERLAEAVAQLASLGIEAKYKVADAASYDETEQLADFAWESFGKVDVLVNNAGISLPAAPVLDMPLEHFQKVFQVNYFGVLNGAKVFGKRFVEQARPAALYNVGSENSLFHATAFNGAYVGSKHAVYALSHSLREELPEFIDVSLICPGFVFTELGPEAVMQMGMPIDEFIDITLPQLKANKFFVVSHAYNMVHIQKKMDLLQAAYDTYAPRYEGDSRYDIRTHFQGLLEKNLNHRLREI